MNAPQVSIGAPNATGPNAVGSYEHFEQAAVDDATLKDITALIHRVTGKALANAKACVLWAEEVIVYRDKRGALRGAHGFRYTDVSEGEQAFRVIYTVFSVVDERADNVKTQLGQVGVRIYGRERLRHRRLPIVWALAPNGLSNPNAAPVGMSDIRRIGIAAASQLPQNVRLFTDQAAPVAGADIVPGSVELAVSLFLQQQREVERDAQHGRLPTSPLKRVAAAVTGLATIAGAAMIFLTFNKPATIGPQASTRTKGSLGLHVYRQKDTGSEEVLSGDPFAPGDTIRFGVDLPSNSRVRVVGVQADGKLYVAWPLSGASGDGLISAGDDQVLSGAVSLDGTPGREMLYLVSCPPSVTDPSCSSRGPGQEPLCPPSCELSPFILQKGAK